MTGETAVSPYNKLPKAPEMLNKHGKKVYSTLGLYLLNVGILNEMNIGMFSALCREYGIYWEAEEGMKELKDRYETITDKAGNDKTVLTAKHLLSKESLRLAMKISVEFGLTPASVSKIVFQSKRKKGIKELLD
jgi:P27 family predicted phage terminase small subunit